jgi:hypothetical protein
MPPGVRSSAALTAADRRAQVVAMRRQRASFEEIGRALGVTRQRAHKIYTQELAKIPATQVEEHRAEQLHLIDDAIQDLLLIARDHSRPRNAVEAWNAVARYIELEARLLDLFPPAKSRVQVITEADVQREIDEICVKLVVEGEWTPEVARANGWSGDAGTGRLALPPGRAAAFGDVIGVDPGGAAA